MMWGAAIFLSWMSGEKTPDDSDGLTREEWLLDSQLAEDENFPLLPESPPIGSINGRTPEEEMERLNKGEIQ